MGGVIKTGDPPNENAIVRIGLLPGPIHTDLILPATAAVRGTLGFVEVRGIPINAPGVSWVLIGWGARDFYTTTGTYADLSVGPVWRAITGDSAVMRVVLAGELTDTTGIRWIDISERQLAILLSDVRGGFAGESPVPIDHPGLNGRDVFYPGTGRFNLFRTCNVWVGNVLRRAGVRVGIWTPFTWTLP